MQRQQRVQTRVEGNIIYIVRELRKDSGEHSSAAPASMTKVDTQSAVSEHITNIQKADSPSAISFPIASMPKADTQSVTSNPVLFKVEENEFAAEARRAEKEGNDALKERICSEGISHYARAIRELYGPDNHASNKDNLVRSSAMLRNIAELYGIWGYEEARKSYLRLSRNMVELAIEIK